MDTQLRRVMFRSLYQHYENKFKVGNLNEERRHQHWRSQEGITPFSE